MYTIRVCVQAAPLCDNCTVHDNETNVAEQIIVEALLSASAVKVMEAMLSVMLHLYCASKEGMKVILCFTASVCVLYIFIAGQTWSERQKKVWQN